MSSTAEDICGGSVVKDSKTATDRAACTENLTETVAFSRSSLALDPAEEYKMDNRRRGLALIFNQEHFLYYKERRGTKADRDNLEKRLMELNFEVKTYNDLRQVKVLGRLKEAAEADHSDADCFLLVFLSHGEKDHIKTYDDKISIENITSPFKEDKCRSLVGKPKIFIFQACRGQMYDDPVTACGAGDSVLETNEEVVEAGSVHTLPAGADFIMCYSVAEGYFSLRDAIKGSWYIQDLCELLQEYGNSLEFAELLMLVNRKVSMRSVEKSRDRNAIGKKQVPCFASMLTKKLYFRPKK
ncbi:caspase-6-like isoform X1 [Epinephelus fuscoguttatus]|uniref:caspase-6-like isoform X1 n=1 Tax=Epinephelus fuscoguttatus TaxID=293821 RepID=UPI0020D0C589|nr:caspase-6-like isoform X1 [Epinephelus fuscoguttatus]